MEPWVETGHLWEPGTKPLSPLLFAYSIHLWGIRAWFSHVPFSTLLYLKETRGQKLSILSLWAPLETNSDQNSWDRFFLESCQSGNWPEYLLTCKSTRRSCRAGHFIMSTPPLPLGSDNPMTAAFISIFQPLLFPWHIVTTEQIRLVSAAYKRDLNVTLATSICQCRILEFDLAKISFFIWFYYRDSIYWNGSFSSLVKSQPQVW